MTRRQFVRAVIGATLGSALASFIVCSFARATDRRFETVSLPDSRCRDGMMTDITDGGIGCHSPCQISMLDGGYEPYRRATKFRFAVRYLHAERDYSMGYLVWVQREETLWFDDKATTETIIATMDRPEPHPDHFIALYRTTVIEP